MTTNRRANRAHVTSEWARGTVTIQVAHDTEGGRYLGYMEAEAGHGEVPRLTRVYLPHAEGAVAAESEARGHAPGFALHEDDAILVWEALDEYLHNTGQSPTKALQEALTRATDAERSLAILQERVIAADALKAALIDRAEILSRAAEREALGLDLERARVEQAETPRVWNLGQGNVQDCGIAPDQGRGGA